MNTEIEARRVEWRIGPVVSILIDLDNGQTVARILSTGVPADPEYLAEMTTPFERSHHGSHDEATRWVMERV